ncbi:MAG: hypothetical protein ABGY72_02505 [bacterium]
MMNQIMTRRVLLTGLSTFLFPAVAWPQRRRRVVGRQKRVGIRAGHPIRRSVNRTVSVSPARRTVVVSSPLTYLPVIAFAAVVATVPARERLRWQDTDTIDRDEEWVECNFGIDDRGSELFLQVDGRAQFDFADITFNNGEVQVVDFNEKTYSNGVYTLLDFRGQRLVKTARLVAQSKSAETTLRVYLS